MPQKRPKNIILVYRDGSYKGYSYSAFLNVCKIQFEEWEGRRHMRL